MFTTVQIRNHERGLLFRNGDLVSPLPPGRHRFLNPPWDKARYKVEVFDTLKPRFEHPQLDILVRNDELRKLLTIVELGDTQRAVILRDARVFALLGPGKYAFWNTPARIDVELYDISALKLETPRLSQIIALPNAALLLEGVVVPEHEQVLIFRDGRFLEVVGPGQHTYWKGAGKVTWKAVDLREQVADVSGQEIISADKVSLRVNLLVTWQVNDVLASATRVPDAAQTLYREAQLVLREAVGTRTLDALLEAKDAVGREVRDMLATRMAELGISVRSVGMKDIILPGDMKVLFNQVIAAQKEADANLIKRREETAAARSQANTARLLAESPQLMRLKELELLKDVLSGTTATFVLGPSELAQQLQSLIATK